MKLEKVLFEKHSEIDEIRRRERNKVSYLCHLIDINYEKIAKELKPLIDKELETSKYLIVPMTSEEYFENRIYENIESIITELSSNFKDVDTNFIYPVETESIDVLLGYSKYYKKDKESFFRKELTEKGVIEVNNYREIIGRPSIEIEKKAELILKKISK